MKLWDDINFLNLLNSADSIFVTQVEGEWEKELSCLCSKAKAALHSGSDTAPQGTEYKSDLAGPSGGEFSIVQNNSSIFVNVHFFTTKNI